MDKNTLEILSVIGTWIASIGTVSAVITSLWLAYRQDKIKLKVYAGHRVIMGDDSTTSPDVCSIRVVNTSRRPAKIINVGWVAGRFKNKKNFLQLFNIPGSAEIPQTLNEGDEAHFMVPFRYLGTDEDWIHSFPRDLAGKECDKTFIKTLKVGVYTSVGQNFTVPVERNLVAKLLDSLDAEEAPPKETATA